MLGIVCGSSFFPIVPLLLGGVGGPPNVEASMMTNSKLPIIQVIYIHNIKKDSSEPLL